MEGSEEKSSVQNHHLDEHEPQEQLGLGLGFQHSPPSSPPPIRDPNHDDLDRRSVDEELQNQQCVNGEVEEQSNVDEEFQNLVLEEDKGVDVIGAENEEVAYGDEREEGSERGADPEVAVEEDGDKTEKAVIDEDGDSKDGDEKVVVDDDDDGGDYRSGSEEGFGRSENVEGDSSLSAVGLSMEGKYRRYHYPVRPDAEDCSYYIRNGSCKFGSNCKFNHPPKKRNQAAKEVVKEKEENTEKPGQIECKYYLRSGGCKYGKACRYNHTRGRTPVALSLELNFVGLPIRLGEKECPYYMRNGSCKYGSACRFNHPNPTAVAGGDPAGYSNGRSVPPQGASQSTMSSWSSPRTLKETAPFVPMMFSPTHGVPPQNTEWNSYQAPVYPAPEGSLPTPPAFAMNIPVTETNFYPHHQQQIVVDEFPERPGQPECSYYMKTGDCKYRSGCKFHHPMSRISKAPTFSLSDKGLPLRPDQNICTHYNRYGICKFGPACKFDHPVNFALSSSSGVSGPDHPSPFGNSVMAGRARMAGSENGGKPLIQQRV